MVKKGNESQFSAICHLKEQKNMQTDLKLVVKLDL